jgi:hypothetical protein
MHHLFQDYDPQFTHQKPEYISLAMVYVKYNTGILLLMSVTYQW